MIFTLVTCTALPGSLCLLHNKMVANVQGKAALLVKIKTIFWLKGHIVPDVNHWCPVPGFHLLCLSTSQWSTSAAACCS